MILIELFIYSAILASMRIKLTANIWRKKQKFLIKSCEWQKWSRILHEPGKYNNDQITGIWSQSQHCISPLIYFHHTNPQEIHRSIATHHSHHVNHQKKFSLKKFQMIENHMWWMILKNDCITKHGEKLSKSTSIQPNYLMRRNQLRGMSYNTLKTLVANTMDIH